MIGDSVTIRIDTSQAAEMIADCLAPGAVLLPASVVQAIYEEYGICTHDLQRLGAIVADDEVVQ